MGKDDQHRIGKAEGGVTLEDMRPRPMAGNVRKREIVAEDLVTAHEVEFPILGRPVYSRLRSSTPGSRSNPRHACAPTNLSASVEALLGVIEFWVAIDATSRVRFGSPRSDEARACTTEPGLRARRRLQLVNALAQFVFSCVWGAA